MFHICFFLWLLFNLIIFINGNHFLGGTITWQPLNKSASGTPVAIVITQTYSWSTSYVKCNSTQIANSELISTDLSYNGINNTLDCIINCGSGSVGYIAPPIIPFCTDASSKQGTVVGQRSDIVYLQENDDFTAAFQDTGWRVLTASSSNIWSLASRIAIQPRSDNGLYNTAPVATVMSPINIPNNQTSVISVPVGDADGDTTKCRWANGSNECGGVCPPSSLPPNTSIYPNCTIVITGQNIGDWFAVALVVEDFINSSSTFPLSSVPVQFLVQVVTPPSCSIPPDIIGLPAEQSCIPVKVGEIFNSQLIAINYCGANITIQDIATLSFSGMTKSAITKLNATIYYKNLTWIPTLNQLGYQVMCAMAINSTTAITTSTTTTTETTYTT
ncbi:unnamed protein product [Adineta steineri]|uniref:Uncharacterized protein n=1 Tax=Adineta steineri TaxID=433720 RepID=A0A814JRU8_9BILA|nr:unnamed protein product [Adineta steineri]CAF1102722.1 unnamed protein product [Adineta steineri]